MTIKEQAIKWVQEYFAANGNENTKAIIGISGGKDSSTVAALCCAALGKERVIGVMMPNGVQSDIDDSKKLCDFLGIECYTVNIEKSFNGITEEILTQTKNTEFNNQYKTNMPSRLRMATLANALLDILLCGAMVQGILHHWHIYLWMKLFNWELI